jgi:hypothetical protein
MPTELSRLHSYEIIRLESIVSNSYLFSCISSIILQAAYIGCSFCRLIRRPERLIGRHWYLPANWRSLIRCSPDQWVSHCYTIKCDRSFYRALFCVFMTRVSQCPISLRAEHPIDSYGCQPNKLKSSQKENEIVKLCVPLSTFFRCLLLRFHLSHDD